jgi:pyruvate/2-oxoglutarate dehydrogenase complex dihydrolipoamide dehydrogenase (E3) component
MITHYDFIVIGGGSAGYNAAAQAVRLGLKTAVIDGAKELGGLCILRGCMPSKTLIESADRFLTLRRAGEFGLSAERIGHDGAAILARKHKLIGEFAEYRRQQLESGKFSLVRGWASFVDAHTLAVQKVDGEVETLAGKTFLICTGSKIQLVGIPGLAKAGYWDTDAVLESAVIPKSIVILGGGFSALEFAHYYSALGVETTLLQRSGRVMKEMDEDVTDAVTAALEKHGAKLICNTSLSRVERTPNGRRIHFSHEGKAQVIEAEQIVYAMGRQPQTEQLALEKAGVAICKGYVEASLTQQTSVAHIFAAGDVCGPYEIVHLAIQQGEIAARNAARLLQNSTEEPEAMDYRLKMSIVFTHPEVATIGWSELELRAQGRPYLTASYPFNDHGKSLVMGETDGFVKLIVEEGTREILGAAVVGPRGSDLIHELSAAMYFRATAMDLLRIPHYHPTLSEIWTYPAEELSV